MKHFHLRWSKLHYVILLLFIMFGSNSCRKADSQDGFTDPVSLQERFFSTAPNTPLTVQKLSKALEAQKGFIEYLPTFIKVNGTPRWDKVLYSKTVEANGKVATTKSGDGQIYFIPLIGESDSVQAYIAAKSFNDKYSFQLYNKDTLDAIHPQTPVKKDELLVTYAVLAELEKDIHGTTSYKVNNSAISGTLKNVSINTVPPPVMVENAKKSNKVKIIVCQLADITVTYEWVPDPNPEYVVAGFGAMKQDWVITLYFDCNEAGSGGGSGGSSPSFGGGVPSGGYPSGGDPSGGGYTPPPTGGGGSPPPPSNPDPWYQFGDGSYRPECSCSLPPSDELTLWWNTGTPVPETIIPPTEPYPSEFGAEMFYDSDWEANEQEFIDIMMAFGGPLDTDPVPESYYNGVQVDMSQAPVKGSTLTALGHPRNKQWFWEQVYKQKPEMFDQQNLNRIFPRAGQAPLAPIVNNQWVKYNPSHAAYVGDVLQHHHIDQGQFAAAIPKKVHEKWSRILHTYRGTTKLSTLRNRLNDLAIAIDILQSLADYYFETPDRLINMFRPYNELNKVYYIPQKDVYVVITEKHITKNANGDIIKIDLTYTAYEESVYDPDEHKQMGFMRLGKYRETYDAITQKSTFVDFSKML